MINNNPQSEEYKEDLPKTHSESACEVEAVENNEDNESVQPEITPIPPTPKRKYGTVTGFNTCDENYLQLIIDDLNLDCSIDTMKYVQRIYTALDRTPTVADLYFSIAGIKAGIKRSNTAALLDSLECHDGALRELLSSLIREYTFESSSIARAPALTSLAEFAATGKIEKDNCGLHLSLSSAREFPPLFNGETRFVNTGTLCLSLSSGESIGGNNLYDLGVLLYPKDGENTDSFITRASRVCREYLEIFPDSMLLSLSRHSLIKDIEQTLPGALLDVRLLPVPSDTAESVFEPLAPAVMIFIPQTNLKFIAAMANKANVSLCVPLATRTHGITIKAFEGDVSVNDSLLRKFDYCIPLNMYADTAVTLDGCGKILNFSIDGIGHNITATEICTDDIYAALTCAMPNEEGTVYVIGGTLSLNSPSTVPAIVTLDCFRRNYSPAVVYSRFFMGERTSITVFAIKPQK